MTVETNEKLMTPYTMDEVRQALFQMQPTKAPGVNGFPVEFYQKFWNVVGAEVGDEVLRALNSGMVYKDWNET